MPTDMSWPSFASARRGLPPANLESTPTAPVRRIWPPITPRAYTVWTNEDRHLSEADVHDMPAGSCRARRERCRFRRCRLLPRSDSEEEAARAASQDAYIAA